MTPAELAEKLEALLALREKAALATTVPFQPADACWSIAEYCGETEDLVANSMSFNVAKFFSEVSNQSPDLLRQAAARLRSMEEALRPFAGVCDVLAAKKTWGTSGPMDVGPSDMGPNVEVFTVGNENGYATVRVEQFFAVSAVLNGEGQ